MKCLLAVITLFSWIGVAVSVPCPIPDFYNEDFEPFRSQSKTEFRTKRRLFLRCKEAYVKDSGTNWIVCQSNGEWRNYGQLQCKLRSCRLPDHTSLPHGDYEIDDNGDFTVGQRMRITCDDGYEMDTLNGSPWRRCMANGEINYEWPRCEPKRCSKPAIDDKMEVSLSIVDNWDFYHGDSVYVKCPGGYDVTGTRKSNDHIFCKSGSWSKEFKCEEKTCQDPDIIDGYVEKSASNDEKCEEKWFSGCQADVKCVEGAAVRNYEDRTIVCSSDGFWDNVPQCYKYCTSDSITNGYLENHRRERVIKNGQTGTYHCDWGYKRNTDYNEVKCMFSVVHVRSWSGSWYRDYEYNDAPSCKPKPTELRRADGTLYYNSADDSRISGYSTDLEHDTGVRMECDSGYQIPEGYVSGQSVYFRAYFGEWKYQFNERSRNDTNQPKCEEAPCDVPTNDHTYYKDADWSNEDITGEVKSGLEIYAYCDDDDYELVEVNNGRIDRPDRNRMDCTKGTWNRQVRCREKSCYFANPDRKTLRLSDNVEEEGYKLHDRDMTIKCAEGYEFKPGVDEQFVKCQYGTWIDDNNGDVTTECSAKPCEVPSNDFTSYKKYQDGESITGYRQSGRSIYVRCESADYERVEVNVNGDMERTTQDRMRCSTGNWNLQLKCREKSCNFANPDRKTLRLSGVVEEEGYKLHDRDMTIVCAEGYEFERGVGEQYVKCQYGKWKDDNGREVTTECTAKPCVVPSNAFTFYKKSQGGESITGYRQRGDSIYVSCESDDYERVEVIDNGDMERTTQDMMYCRTGNWNLQLKCREKSCPIDDKRNLLGQNGRDIELDYFNHDSSLAIKCGDGYQFINQDNVTSMRIKCDHGTWLRSNTKVTPSCTAKPCDVPSNGFTYYSEYKNGGSFTGHRESGYSIYVRCESDNYEVVEINDNGKMERTEQNAMRCRRGNWITQLKCHEKSCPIDGTKNILRRINNGIIHRNHFQHNEGLAIKCEEGHQFVDQEDVTSMDIECDHGRWRNSANNEEVTPSCGEEPCTVRGHRNTHFTVDGEDVNTVQSGRYVSVNCSEGYELKEGVATDRMYCEKGRWDSNDKWCKPESCQVSSQTGTVFKDENTRIWGGFRRHGDSLTVSCSEGHSLTYPRDGPTINVTCQYGKWKHLQNQDVYAFCKQDIVSCPVTKNDNTVYTPDDALVTPGNRVTVKCRSGDYEIIPGQKEGVMTCGDDGSWDHDIHCQPKRCQATPTKGAELKNLNTSRPIRSATWFEHGFDALRLNCDQGFKTEHDKNVLRAVCHYGNWIFFVNRSKTIEHLRCFHVGPAECQLQDINGVKYVDGPIKINPMVYKEFGWNTELSFTCNKADTVKIKCMFGHWEPPVECQHIADRGVKRQNVRGSSGRGQMMRGQSVRKQVFRRKSVRARGVWKPAVRRKTSRGPAFQKPGREDCTASPCKNGGRCYGKENGGYKCICVPERYYGVNCEKAVDKDTLCSSVINPEEIELFHGPLKRIDKLVENKSLQRDTYYSRYCPRSETERAFDIICREKGVNSLHKFPRPCSQRVS